jgi:hypothetical protein
MKLHAVKVASCTTQYPLRPVVYISIRAAVSLRLGCGLCHVHTCQCARCFRRYAWLTRLVLQRNAGSIQDHAVINDIDIIYKTMIRASIPVANEPQGLVRTDGKGPDGLTLVPYGSRDAAPPAWDLYAFAHILGKY